MPRFILRRWPLWRRLDDFMRFVIAAFFVATRGLPLCANIRP